MKRGNDDRVRGVWMANRSNLAVASCELLTALAIALVLLTACSPQTKARADNAPAKPPWRWELYPSTNRIRLATVSCKVQAKSSLTLTAPITGMLHVHVHTQQTNLTARTIWAEFEPKQFIEEAKALKDAAAQLSEREKSLLNINLPRQKLKITRELYEAERQLAMLNLMRTNNNLTLLPSLGLKNPSLNPKAQTMLQVEVDLIRRTLDAITKTNLVVLGFDLTEQRANLKQRQRDFDRRRKQARLKMPTTGQLSISLPLTEGVNEYWVHTGQDLAVARDFKKVYVRAVLADPAWAGQVTGALGIVIRFSNGQELTAKYVYQRLERTPMREEAAAYFLITAPPITDIQHLVGREVTGELNFNLGRPARVVPKLTLVMHDPSAFQGRSWSAGVHRLWPDARVVAEGQTEVAIELGPPEAR